MRKLTLIVICIVFSAGIALAQNSLPGNQTCRDKMDVCFKTCKIGQHHTDLKCTDACKVTYGEECIKMQAIQSSTNKGKISPPSTGMGTRRIQ